MGAGESFITSLPALFLDRKSTRLNSSHVRSSYAVFCLKKKMSRRNFTNLALSSTSGTRLQVNQGAGLSGESILNTSASEDSRVASAMNALRAQTRGKVQ